MSDLECEGWLVEVEALWQRLAELEDGSLDPAERDRLMVLLDESRAARRLYSEYFAHSVGLEAEARFLDELGRLPVLADALWARRIFRRSVLAAAALLVFGAIVASLVMVKTPKPGALKAAATADAKWTVDGLARDPAADEWSVAAGSTVQVWSGTLKLRLESGAAMVMQGPAKASFPEPERPVLSHGWLWLDSGASDRSFVVETPDLRVRDIGTRFGLLVPEQGPAEVHLIEGKVEVVAKAGGRTIATFEPQQRGMVIPALGEPAGVALARDPFPGLAELLAAAGELPDHDPQPEPGGILADRGCRGGNTCQ